ncbi:hypothetical protein CGI93_17610 [Vibrio parahaemolyticus]|uniref:HNH endonuclease n=1 Tax=Vibrio parahaemolyticus TaxID=670 RepID=UPI00111F89B5|nr:HNH endonuclease [Vibrio parahaemolyticus]TOG82165.1 hypothetical protein CGI93_17610 [Vibrio parahaemolyticus]
MAILEQVEALLRESGRELFSAAEIKAMMAATHGTNPKSVLPADYCYNRTNFGIDKSGMLVRKFLIFLSGNQYRYVGFDYKFNGYVYQKPQGSKSENIVGYWNNGVYSRIVDVGNDLEDLGDREYVEGATKQIIVNSYERDRAGRRKCLELHGYSCWVCGFDFFATYGELGKDYIHVHHIVPISSIRRSYKLTPETDLLPLCPNCHAMVHRHDPALHPQELKDWLEEKNA